jgi:hypothetical protein
MLAGCSNFRELGGMPVRGGGRTRWGRLHRGDRIGIEARAGLESLGIDAVIDLRTHDERAVDASLLAEAISVPLFEVVPGEWSAPVDLSPRAIASRYMAMAEAGQPALRVIASIMQARGSVVIHCAAGRDRTGIVIASILAAIGVEREAIVADYAESSGRCHDKVPADAETMRLFLDSLVPCPELTALEGRLVERFASGTG